MKIFLLIAAVIVAAPIAWTLYLIATAGKDAGPPPPSGHGWIAPNKPR